jgi:hypothetical protein
MKNLLSLITCSIIAIIMLQYRYNYSDLKPGNPPLKITEWDALGYYIYLPSIIIYHDYTQLAWLPEVDNKYGMSGGTGYPVTKLENGNYTYKYLGGVALMELPFFLIAHGLAEKMGYPPDGFSRPYQYAITFGVILYCLLGLLLLRRILLMYYTDLTTSITLACVCLATNFIEYAAIENGQSHAFIFPLYILVVYATIKWHERPSVFWAAVTGYVVGLATMCRPTEAIMIFIPIMWATHASEAAKEKWALVKQHRSHVLVAVAAGLVGVLPQLLYWKSSTGSFIYDVGSAWDFLNPHFRVLFGWEKGWFIYTPATVFFMVGMFYIKKFPFRKSVLWFCLLNIYIVIGWREWRYGGSYSTRALMQSYPLFALAMGAFVERMNISKLRWPFYLLLIYLTIVNLFQLTQYHTTVLHYDDMNRRYYSRIYLNTHPTPIDMSVLDSNEVPDENVYRKEITAQVTAMLPLQFEANAAAVVFEKDIIVTTQKDAWLKIETNIKAPNCLWLSYLHAELRKGDSVTRAKVRLYSPISRNDASNTYIFYMPIPEYFSHGHFKLYVTSPFGFRGIVEQLKITELK